MVIVLLISLNIVFSSNYLREPAYNLVVPSIDTDNIYKLEFNFSYSKFNFNIKQFSDDYLNKYFWSKSTYSKDFLNLGFDFTFFRTYNYFEAIFVARYGSARNDNYYLESGLNFKAMLNSLKYFEMFYLKLGLTYIHSEQVLKIGTNSFDLIQAGLSSSIGVGIKLLAYKNTLLGLEFEKKYLFVNKANIFYTHNSNKTKADFKNYLGSVSTFSTILVSLGWYI